MIPKIIHYCWFGHGEKPELAERCISSWKKYCPDYQIVEWNEENFDITKAPLYVQQAYEAKKWAFATDYIRLWAVYTYGGIYLDTDVEIIRPWDELLALEGFLGFETQKDISTGLGFGAAKGNRVIKELMDTYNTKSFLHEDGTVNLTPGPIMNTEFLLTKGLKLNNRTQKIDDITVFPKDYFCPQDFLTGKISITKNTYSIHRYAASWNDGMKVYKNTLSAWLHTSKTADYLIHFPNRVARKMLGNDRYEALKKKLRNK